MALYQPTQIIPSVLSGLGDGVIDATQDLTVSWQINGFSPMTAHRIVICQNDTASTEMLDTGKITLNTPFYGTDQNGDQSLFEATPITAAALASAGIVNGYENGYKLIITQWWSANDSIEQTSPSVFITRNDPVLTMGAIASPLASKELSVSATYTQAQGDTLAWARWVLSDAQGNVLKDTGRVSTGVLQFDYDGLFSGSSYTIECSVETENGVQATTGETAFTVSYALAPSEGLVDVCRRGGQPYVEISWSDRTAIEGEPTGAYTLAGGLLRLQEGSSVTWDKIGEFTLAFPPEWSLAWRGIIPNPTAAGFDAVALTLPDSHSLKIHVALSAVSIVLNGTAIVTQALSMKKNDVLVVVLTSSGWWIKQVTYDGGLYPATDLYPSATLYPSPVTRAINNWNGTVTYTQEDVNGITLNGAQTCEYIWLYTGAFSDNAIQNMTGSEWFEPSYDASTYFIATFANNDLTADITGGTGDVAYGMTIYRREGTSAVLQRVADVDAGYTIARDYGCKSNTPYTYYLYLRGETTYISAPYESRQITPGFNFYTLLECRQDDTTKNLYHVLQAFLVSGNLSQSAVGNGNSPRLLENFTPYPLRQGTPHNYKSGTLTSLIGAVDYGNNAYSDTWELADSIQALSLSQNTLFLRDMKGALWRIHTTGPVMMGINDKSYAQPIQMSFPWAEIGSAEGVSIVALPTDSLWENDEIIDTTVYVDPDTGCLMWTVPDDYEGSTLLLTASGDLAAQGSGTIEMAELSIDDDMNLIATE